MKYFVVSDIHGFYEELIRGLKKAGFDKNNKDHTLIVCGDVFDRGPDNLKVYKFIRSIPKSRRILVRGNHELLFLSLLNKEYPESHDFGNHTVSTFCQIAKDKFLKEFSCEPREDILEKNMWKYVYGRYSRFDDYYDYGTTTIDAKQHWKDIVKIVKQSPITKWLKSSEWLNYYELNNFIFVHSFIPVGVKDKYTKLLSQLLPTDLPDNAYQYNPNWRKADDIDWEDATWGAPWKMYQLGLFKEELKKGKVLVCGHWHTSDFFKKLSPFVKVNEVEQMGIYYDGGIIGLDGGCYILKNGQFYHPQNVLVIDGETLKNREGKILTPIKSVVQNNF